MTAEPFDTLKLADKLEAGGFTSTQARTAASAFAEAMSGADLATRADITGLRSEIKSDLAETKVDIMKTIIRAVVINSAVVVGGDRAGEVARALNIP